MIKPITAVLPAAGLGSRLGLTGSSKEVVSIGTSSEFPAGRPVIDHLVERLSGLGLAAAKIVTLASKTDIHCALGNERHGIALEYLVTSPTPSSVHTVAQALRSEPPEMRWALGFPDILFEPKNAYVDVLRRLDQGADLALGLFPSDRPEKTDMVDLGPDGRVRGLRIKRADIGWRYAWAIACWGERFTSLLLAATTPAVAHSSGELFVGDIISTAIAQNLNVAAVRFPSGWALDVGTPNDLARARQLHQ